MKKRKHPLFSTAAQRAEQDRTDAIVEAFERRLKKKPTKEEAREFLISIGVLTKTGKLSKNFYG